MKELLIFAVAVGFAIVLSIGFPVTQHWMTTTCVLSAVTGMVPWALGWWSVKPPENKPVRPIDRIPGPWRPKVIKGGKGK